MKSVVASVASSAECVPPVWLTDELPPTQRKMLKMLGDGMPHTIEELFTCLFDEMGKKRTVSVHLVALRKLLRPKGMDILVQFVNRKMHYRQVRLMRPADV